MSSVNLHRNEIGIKVVYYGPGLGGKTSALQYMHAVLKPENRGRLISLATGIDRTLYFDFLPIQLPRIRNFSIRMSLYTVPGQVHYNATRKLVLQGADGVIFVADSQASRHEANVESIENLYANLREHGVDPTAIPLVLQYNKRDIPDVLPVSELNRDLNPRDVPWFETSAVTGQGIFDALKTITKLVLTDLKRQGIYRDPAPPNAESDAAYWGVNGDALPWDGEDGDLSGAPQALAEHREAPATLSERSTSIEAAIVDHVASHPASDAPPPKAPVNFSDLWSTDAAAQRIAALESDIAAGHYRRVIEHAPQLLATLLPAGGTFASTEAFLLALGTNGAYWARFSAITHAPHGGLLTRADALFCLFFLTDVELRLQSAGVRT
ncbi:MAG: GTPase domain-containing protein [Myxococcales bacterium]|jgi:signal recognition particle receptor subunit beta|nr:GTPase domain-containing protein [Myxococcales bacterium]